MVWPLPTDFVPMLQNPRIGFRNAELKGCTIELDGNYLPRARAGAFAVVYKGTYPENGRNVCIRVFTTASQDRRERYSAISKYLGSKRLNSLVGFDYSDNGIKCARDGQWYPLVTMDWVDGDVLFDWVRNQCGAKQKRNLGQAAEHWVEVIDELTQAKIAHGDLQHGNVMVTRSGQLKLVDYDCMCVPTLVGQRNLEIGVEPYQHPRRDETTLLYPGLDNFSALFIWVALRAFATSPELWSRYVEPPGKQVYDKLLFRKTDFDNPFHSQLYEDLRNSADHKLRKLTDDLFGLVRVPLQDVPPLSHFVHDFEAIKQLLSRQAWDQAVELLNRGQTSPEPAELVPQFREARERIRCRAELEKAVAAGDEQQLRQLAASPLLQDYPEARPSLALALQAAEVIPILAQLNQARGAANWKAFVKIWNEHEELLLGRASTAALHELAQDWRARNAASETILQLIQKSPCDVQRLYTLWQGLQRRGGHPDADRQRARVEQLITRHNALVTLQQAPDSLSEQGDETLVSLWNEPLFAGWDLAELERPRYITARNRLGRFQTLQEVLRQFAGSPTPEGEDRIVTAAGALPDGYQHALQSRVVLAGKRLNALKKLQQACIRQPATDAAIAAAWKELAAAEGELLVSPQLRTRAGLAARRAPLLAALNRLSPQTPLDRLDQELLQHWNDELLHDCAEAAPWSELYRRATERQLLLKQLQDALQQHNDTDIAALGKSDLLSDYPLSPQIAERISKATQKVQGVQGLLSALKSRQPAHFWELFDYQLIQHSGEQLRAYQPLICNWFEGQPPAREKLGLKLPVMGPGSVRVNGGSGSYKVQWIWPAPRFTDRCLLAICDQVPSINVDPEQAVSHRRMLIHRKSWESGGGYRIIHVKPEWAGSYIIVWACIDLGFRKFYGEPLVMGRVEGADR